MADRIKRESKVPARYIEEFSSKCPLKKRQTSKKDNNLYDIEVTEVDKAKKRIKIHYIGYSTEYDEWRSFGDGAKFPFVRLEKLNLPSSDSLQDRKEIFHGQLYREIKKKLYSGRRDDPMTRIELRVEPDVFEEGLATVVKAICSYALGMESKMISNAQIAASSTFHSSYPSNARLNYNGAWMTSKDERKNEWLQINFNQIKNINGIATQGRKYEQGRKHEQAWVKEYRLNYTNATYEAPLVYTKDGKPFEFKGNSDHNSIVYNAILPPIIAQIVLIVPTEWETFIALRIELYGCPYKGAYDDRNSM
ncbi:Coagulation factor VIII [Exaiptasia diaphana]|nr:Coagulation factor VIII [Exaiptasia diaphana]